jgi:hypothetical protein
MTLGKPFLRALAVAGLAIAAAACTPMRWEHPQLGVANADADQQECGSLAWRESWQYGWQYGPGYGFWDYPYRARGRTFYRGYPGYRYDPFFEEQRLRDYCMRAKGYQMVPIPG